MIRFGRSIAAGLFVFFSAGNTLLCLAENYTTNVVNGVATNAGPSIVIGNTGSLNFFEVLNGGSVLDTVGTVGFASTSASNNVLLTGASSTWNNAGVLTIGATGAFNVVTISNTASLIASGVVLSATSGCFSNGIVLNGGSLFVTNLIIGGSGQGDLIFNSGTIVAGAVYVGSNNFSTGTLTITGGSLLCSNFFVGFSTSSTGMIQMTGGTFTSTNGNPQPSQIGFEGNGQMILTNATLVSSTLVVGTHGTGTVVMTDGTLSMIHGSIQLASVANSVGSLWVTRGQVTMTNGGIASGSGIAQITVSNSTINLQALIMGGAGGSGTSTLTLNDSTLSTELTSGGSISVGSQMLSTTAVWVVNGQLNDNPSIFYVAPGIQTVAEVTLSNSSSRAGVMVVGAGGIGTLTLAGSTLNIATNLQIGLDATGTVWMTSASAITAPAASVIIGGYGLGLLIVSNGTVQAKEMMLASNATAGAQLLIPGGQVTVYNKLIVGDCGNGFSGQVIVNGGTLYVTNATHTGYLDVRDGTFIINSGRVIVDLLVMTNSCGQLVRNNGTLTYGVLIISPTLSAVGDGIPNGWKIQYDLDPFDPNLGSEDADGDGQSNLQEYLAGTDPTNNASALKVLSITRQANNLLLTWYQGLGRTNSLDVSSGNQAGGFSNNFASIFTVTNATSTITNYLDVGGATNVPSRYYRVRLVP